MVKQQSVIGFDVKLTLLGQCRVLDVGNINSDATGFDLKSSLTRYPLTDPDSIYRLMQVVNR